MKKIILNGKESNIYKVNLHTHTNLSDGLHSPMELCRLYSLAGYDALALTDHRKTNQISELQTTLKEKMSLDLQLISGIELHPASPKGSWHILALGVPEGFPGEYATGSEAAQAARDAGALVFAAHPYWCGFTAQDIIDELGEITGTEVYNASCRFIGKEYGMNIWDDLLDSGSRPGFALAVDDCHNPAHFGMGWTMIAAENPTQDALLSALRKGDFYATQGPEFTRIEFTDKHFIAEFTPAVSACVVSNRNSGRCAASPNWPLPGHDKGEITSVDIDFSMMPEGHYFRLQIRDASGKMAWTMPYFI